MGVAGVPPHAHCEICGTPVAVGTRFCSAQCEERNEELVAEKKKAMWKSIALIAAIALFFTALNQGWI